MAARTTAKKSTKKDAGENKKSKKGKSLTFKRSFEITNALMSGENEPVVIRDIGFRPGQSFKKEEAKEGDGHIDKSNEVRNLQHGERAFLSHNDDKLNIEFWITLLPLQVEAEVTNSLKERNKIKRLLIKLFEEEGELLQKMCMAYAYNILNGSWAWRNRDTSLEASVVARLKDPSADAFVSPNALDMPLSPLLTHIQREQMKQQTGVEPQEPYQEYESVIKPLADLIAKTLLGKNAIGLKVTGTFESVPGARVYPSQCYVPGESSSSTLLFKTNESIASMTSDKIGNRLRAFDVGHGQDRVIAIDPNGVDLSSNEALRNNENSLWDIWPKFIEEQPMTDDEKFFTMAIAVRGSFMGSKDL